MLWHFCFILVFFSQHQTSSCLPKLPQGFPFCIHISLIRYDEEEEAVATAAEEEEEEKEKKEKEELEKEKMPMLAGYRCSAVSSAISAAVGC